MKKEKEVLNKVQEVKFLVDQVGEFGSVKKGQKVYLDLSLAELLKKRKLVEFIK